MRYGVARKCLAWEKLGAAHGRCRTFSLTHSETYRGSPRLQDFQLICALQENSTFRQSYV